MCCPDCESEVEVDHGDFPIPYVAEVTCGNCGYSGSVRGTILDAAIEVEEIEDSD